MSPSTKAEIRNLEQLADFEGILLPSITIELPNPLIYTNIVPLRGSVFAHHLLTANAARSFDQPAVALYRYPAGTVVDGEGREPYVTLTKAGLVRQQFPEWAKDPDRLAADLAVRARNAFPVQAPCLLAARFGDVTWGHWFYEMLTKIVLAEAAEPKKFTFVVSARITRFGGPVADRYVNAVLQSLQAFGIESHRLLRIPPGQAFCFEALFDIAGVYPIPQEEFFGVHPGLISVMEQLLKPFTSGAIATSPYIMRDAADFRQVANHDELIERARHHGYTPVSLIDLDFTRQVTLFREAKSIVAALGSGLSGLIYAKPHLPVLTVAPIDWPDTYFVNIFQKREVFHADVRGSSTEQTSAGIARAPFHVPIEDFDRGVEELTAKHNLVAGIGAVKLGHALVPRKLGPVRYTIVFGEGGNSSCHKGQGWSFDEPKHTWSIGPRCELNVSQSLIGDQDLWLEAFGFSLEGNLKLMSVVINGTHLDDLWVEGRCRPSWLLRREMIALRDPIAIRFLHRRAPSPKSLGLSDDARPLGFGYYHVAFREVVALQDHSPLAGTLLQAEHPTKQAVLF